MYLDEDTPVREGEYVNITYNPFGSSASGIYLQNMFILREGGGSFVYVRDESGKLEKRAVSTGRSLWGSYTQINGGLTGKEYIAFPYGNRIRAGAKTEISDIASFYNYLKGAGALLESISLAFQNVWRHKLRSFLTRLGIVIGIASIITIVSTIKGTNEQIKESLVGAGNNAVVV